MLAANLHKIIFFLLWSEYQDAAVPPAAREHHGKRKRERTSEGEGGEDGGEENVCPNSGVDKTTPVRKARGQAKGGQKLFSSGAGAAKAKGTGEEEEEEEEGLLLLTAEGTKPQYGVLQSSLAFLLFRS